MSSSELSVEVHHPDRPVTVVLVHGAPDRGRTFSKLLGYLPEHRVVTYDRRGYGRSVSARPACGMEDHARDLLEIVSAQPEPHVVVAHSFGSNPALLATQIEPGAFASLGVFEPPMPWLDWWPQSTKDFNSRVAVEPDAGQVGEEIARMLLGEEGWMKLDDDGRSLLRAEGGAFQVDMASEIAEPFDVGSILTPTVVAYATRSPDDRRRGGPWLAERLPDGRLHVIEGGGHFSHRTHPGAFAEFVNATISLALES
jgi:pimeloyl-ACP methyl ester carboxylesterase